MTRGSGALRRALARASLSALALASVACATPAMRVPARVDSGFDPDADVFAYDNQLYWDYRGGVATGEGSVADEPGPAFGQRCAVMARQARQFHYAARFDPSLPRVSDEAYRELASRVLASDFRRESPLDDPVVIPGFANLREFSREHERLLKELTGGRWRTYLQRGNWRMIFPFSLRHQHRTAESLLRSLAEGHTPIVHVMNFPHIDVNHTTLLYRAEADVREIRFVGYDPNAPQRPLALRYDRESARFFLAPTHYFPGGPVVAYEVYHGWLY